MHTKKLKSLIKEMGLDHYRNDRVLSEEIPGTGSQPNVGPQFRRIDVSRPGAPQPPTRVPTSNPVSNPGATQPYGVGPQSHSQPRVAPPGTGPQPNVSPHYSTPNVGQPGATQPPNNYTRTPQTSSPFSHSPQGARGAPQPTIGSSPAPAPTSTAPSLASRAMTTLKAFGTTLGALGSGATTLGTTYAAAREAQQRGYDSGRVRAPDSYRDKETGFDQSTRGRVLAASEKGAKDVEPTPFSGRGPGAAINTTNPTPRLSKTERDFHQSNAEVIPQGRERNDSEGLGATKDSLDLAKDLSKNIPKKGSMVAEPGTPVPTPTAATTTPTAPPAVSRIRGEQPGPEVNKGPSALGAPEADGVDPANPPKEPTPKPAEPANRSPERTPEGTPEKVARAITKQTKTSSDSGSLSGYSDWAQDAFGRNRG